MRERLDGLVVNMELTLISIIQGVALYFLTESSRGLIVAMRFEAWPYIAVALVTIFLFWSRSLIHTFTVIRWPLEFGHNFIYIACTLVEAVMFTQIADLENWFMLGTAYGLMVWLLFVFDLGMIRRRHQQAPGDELAERLESDQVLNVRMMLPGFVVFHAAAWFAVHTWPETFINNRWHLLLVSAQLLGGIAYLAYVLSFFRRVAPLIVRRER